MNIYVKESATMTAKEYPNDRRVDVIRANGSTYRIRESTNLLTTHGWTPSEVRVMQMDKH